MKTEAARLRRFELAQVATLATTTPDGRPHIVPITFALSGSQVVTMVDHKPKSTTNLKRLRNVIATPVASVLVDHYDDDWRSLWWVRIDGAADVVTDGSNWERARDALRSKYSQYRDNPPTGPAILIGVDTISGWESTP